jgi:hypothetical protein
MWFKLFLFLSFTEINTTLCLGMSFASFIPLLSYEIRPGVFVAVVHTFLTAVLYPRNIPQK